MPTIRAILKFSGFEEGFSYITNIMLKISAINHPSGSINNYKSQNLGSVNLFPGMVSSMLLTPNCSMLVVCLSQMFYRSPNKGLNEFIMINGLLYIL